MSKATVKDLVTVRAARRETSKELLQELTKAEITWGRRRHFVCVWCVCVEEGGVNQAIRTWQWLKGGRRQKNCYTNQKANITRGRRGHFLRVLFLWRMAELRSLGGTLAQVAKGQRIDHVRVCERASRCTHADEDRTRELEPGIDIEYRRA
ncbi:hypothetical protein T492DRAFT_220836 [Pavlovales sp. CCMP2436]|nr:hypothetical protein T492DRAFT_220836 [Pavlovales sp. CCMP2436]